MSALRDGADLVEVLGVPYTDEQLIAITAPLAPAVIVAGAGSGKTTVMAARVVWLVGTGQVPAAGVLGLTFTNKAAAELSGRVRAALARAGIGAGEDPTEHGDVGEPTVATYHAFAGTLLADHGLRLGVEPRSRLLADASRYQLAARAICAAPGPYPSLTKRTADLVVDVLALDGAAAEHLVDLDVLRAHDRALFSRLQGEKGADSPTSAIGKVLLAAGRRLELCDLVAAYRQAKADRDLVDFGDQMSLAARLAEQCPAVGEIERARYRVVLLDEYQDTSVAQRRMLVGLFGGGHPVTAVGDPCQAIYGWRGASVANLEDFPTHFRAVHPDGATAPAQRFTLRENRRNGEVVLDLANALAAPLREIHDGVAALTAAEYNLGMGEIRTAVLDDYPSEMAWVGEQVAAALADGVSAREVAVLVRATRDIGPLHAELVRRDIPVEVVGLGGLVHLPEIADVVATLEVLDDATANAALVRLLTGPRWRIGARDLALLGRRAAQIVAPARPSGLSSLESAPGVTDPTERISLSDALAAPGESAFSTAARDRFAALERELRDLRRHLGEPLLDLVHRVLAVTGLGVEIAAAEHAVAARRRESLSAFLDEVAGFAGLDGESSVAAFLAYLHAAEEHERGLDSATPGTADSVKLMTTHKAKGLEWDVVVLPDVTRNTFPSNLGRPRWTSRGECLPHVLRGDRDGLPDVGEWTPKGIGAFEAGMREQSDLEELRLAYVAVTRPRRRLVMSAHWWGPTQKKPRGPSPYLLAVRDVLTERGLDPGGPWVPAPEPDAENPLRGRGTEFAWPAPLNPDGAAARRAAAGLVRAAMRRSGALAVPAGLSVAETARVASWDRDLELLLAEAARAHRPEREVVLPASLSASQVMALAADPDGLARDLARPLPRAPRTAARRGTRFHDWVEARFGQQALLEPEEIPGAADADLADEDFDALAQAFLRSEYAHRVPYRVEAPFALALGGRIVRGRIDAIYQTLVGYEVIDWKTHARESADPLQLALYRLAWAELAGVEPAAVEAAFYYVRSGRTVRPVLPDRAELEGLLGSGTA
ncbi:MAG TPA: ATP-dependent DNA helicase [Sporichthyaceae bacterium]|nr:ATP-dependent DNA helicase [Sporichthyaceae bacterium]